MRLRESGAVDLPRLARYVALVLVLLSPVVLCGAGCPTSNPPASAPTGRGTVNVSPEPDSIGAGWFLERYDLPGGRQDTWSGDTPRTLRDMRPGNYTISWTDVVSYEITGPVTETQQLFDDEIITFETVYEFVGHVRIVLSPYSLNAAWEIEGPGGFHEYGAGNDEFTGVPGGEYTVTWFGVDDYVTPSPSTVMHEYGTETEILGVYQPIE